MTLPPETRLTPTNAMLTLALLQERGQFMRKFWSGLIGIAALLSFQSAAAQSSGELSIGQVVGGLVEKA